MSGLPRFTRAFFAPGVIAVAVIGALYCIFDRLGANQLVPGTWEVVATAATSPQFLGYVVVPSWLLFCLADAEHSRLKEVLLRSGTFTRLWLSSLNDGVRILASGALLTLILCLISCTGLSPESRYFTLGVGNASVLIGAPTLVFGEICLLGAVLVVVRSLLLALSMVSHRRWPSVLVALGGWLWVIASVTGVIGPSSPGNAIRYFELPAMVVAGSFFAVAGLLVVLFGLSAFAITALDRKYRGTTNLISARSAFVSIAILVNILAVVAVSSPTHGFYETLSLAFVGNGGTITSAMVGAFTGVGYGYVAQWQWSSTGEGQRRSELLRYGTRGRRSRTKLQNELIPVVAYVVLVTAFVAATALLVSGHDFSPPSAGVAPWLFQLLANSALTVWTNLVCFFVVLEISQRAVAGTLAGGILVVLAIAWPGRNDWYPFGAASMSRAENAWDGVLAATSSMCLVIAVALLVLSLTAIVNSRQAGKVVS